jgi:hypothetical protein
MPAEGRKRGTVKQEEALRRRARCCAGGGAASSRRNGLLVVPEQGDFIVGQAELCIGDRVGW